MQYKTSNNIHYRPCKALNEAKYAENNLEWRIYYRTMLEMTNRPHITDPYCLDHSRGAVKLLAFYILQHEHHLHRKTSHQVKQHIECAMSPDHQPIKTNTNHIDPLSVQVKIPRVKTN